MRYVVHPIPDNKDSKFIIKSDTRAAANSSVTMKIAQESLLTTIASKFIYSRIITLKGSNASFVVRNSFLKETKRTTKGDT